MKESRLLFYHHSKRRQIEIREDGGKRESKMRYSQTHSPESQSLILNNKYTSWSAYFGVDAFFYAVWHNVFSMSVLASLLFLSVMIGAMSLPPPTHFYTKHTGAAENSSSSSSSSRVVLHDVFVFCKLRESARWEFWIGRFRGDDERFVFS